MQSSSKIHNWSYEKKIILFWFILVAAFLSLVVLWIILDTKNSDRSVVRILLERGQSAKQYWQGAAEQKVSE